jgi:hypothetical protein
MSALVLAAGGVAGVYGQFALDTTLKFKIPLGVLLLGTVAAGYALGGDRPGTFGRGVMWSAALIPAVAVLYLGGVAITGRT